MKSASVGTCAQRDGSGVGGGAFPGAARVGCAHIASAAARIHFFIHCPPDGAVAHARVAGKLALRASKQALNRVLGQLEQLGYLERRSEATSRQRTVRCTERGWRELEADIAAMQRLEADSRTRSASAGSPN